jgi:ABC-type proline/glycine betaine transport system ATPase subunit
VRAIMSPAGADGFAGQVAAATKVEAVARRVIEAGQPFAVTDERGELIGQLERRAVLDVLAGPPAEAGRG